MEYQTEAVTMWFDRRLVMRHSPIHGIGTFATYPIREGERLIWVAGGIVYTSADWKEGRVQLAAEQYNEGQIGDDLFIATPISLYYYVNHSCDPNMLNDTAWRDIAAGEEITTDFAYCEASPDYSLEPCCCGSVLCRGRVTGNDWKLPELQKRYRGHFTLHIERLIQELQTNTTD
jgi:SET domain-containing protein